MSISREQFVIHLTNILTEHDMTFAEFKIAALHDELNTAELKRLWHDYQVLLETNDE
jgi:hypothetical protein